MRKAGKLSPNFLCSLVLLAFSAQAVPPLPGTAITNRADSEFLDPTTSTIETRQSNEVVAIVAAANRLSLTPEYDINLPPGAAVELPHTIVNNGNGPGPFALNYNNGAGDDYDIQNLRLVVDANDNGAFDSGEPVLASGSDIALGPGESRSLLLIGDVPAGLADGRFANISISATDSTGTELARVDDIVRIDSQASGNLQLAKSSSVAAANPGETVEFRLDGINDGGTTLRPVAVTVDGTAERYVVVDDSIPANTTFAAVTSPGTGVALYHMRGDPPLSFRSSPPPSLALIDQIAFGFGALPPAASISVSFSVLINQNAGDQVRNIATARFEQSGEVVTRLSNTVTVALPPAENRINFFDGVEPNVIIPIAGSGQALNVYAIAPNCNQNASVIETYPIDLAAQLSGDAESQFVAVETGENSGEFALLDVPTLRWPATPATSNNGTVEVGRNDGVSATLRNCPGVTLTTAIQIDPSGVVFDSATNAPVGAATVRLIGIGAGGVEYIPLVSMPDGSMAPAAIVTASDGAFQFPIVPAGSYRLDVIAPNGFRFPSTQPADQLNAGRTIDGLASFGQTFTLGQGDTINFDIPLDPGTLAGLFAEKSARAITAGVGDVITYDVRITNGTGIALSELELTDTLPAGVEYLAGSARINDAAYSGPGPASGGTLKFDLGATIAGGSHEISYSTRVGPGALGTVAMNRAQANAGSIMSNVATAGVRIEDAAFADEGIIGGKIFVDCNQNRVQDPGDLGIPGVRIFLEDGTWVISDSEGKYSFVGVGPATHVLKLDVISLPEGSELTTLSNRNAGVADSQFVDLKRGEFKRADFAEGSCSEDVLMRVRLRRESGEVRIADTSERLDIDLRRIDRPPNADPRSLPSSGVVGTDGRVKPFEPLVNMQRKVVLAPLGTEVRTPPRIDLERRLATLNAELGFIDLQDGDTLPSRQLSVRVKGAAGADFELSVNSAEVPNGRVGQRSVRPDGGVQAWEYIAVRFKRGMNQLELRQVDSFGNVRGEIRIDVLAPGTIGRLALDHADTAVADGRTPLPIVVRLTDAEDVPVTAHLPITLETTLGWWDVEDLNANEPGVQTVIDGGDAVFDLLPPDTPGDALVRVSSGSIESSTDVNFTPELRPLVVAGVVEGIVGLSRLDEDDVNPIAAADGFEDSIGRFRFSGDGDAAGGRTALYLKGRVRGERLLTLAYDSDKDLKDRLFRDIRPDEFYPVYGDAAVKGFDAQSTGKLFVRVDKGQSFFLYGDYTTQTAHESRKLTNYQRSLNGFKQHYENARTSINVFAAYDNNRQVVIELPARGISGPYEIDDPGFVFNSEIVEIITRNRDQPALVVNVTPQNRFVDYSLDATTGAVFFKQPVPTLDQNLNPNFVRITYESDNKGPSAWHYGFDGQVRLTNWLEAGAAVVKDEDPLERYELLGANLTAALSENTRAVAELAQSRTPIDDQGRAARLELRHEGDRLSGSAHLLQSDLNFVNPNSTLPPGRKVAAIQFAYRASYNTQIEGEWLSTDDRATEASRYSQVVRLHRDLPGNVRAQVGIRDVHETAAKALIIEGDIEPIDFTSVLARMDWQPADFQAASVFTEYEQDVSDSDNQSLAIGAEYQLSDRASVYARHELVSSLTTSFGLSDQSLSQNATLVGMNLDYLDDTRVFSEYRVRDAFSGRESEAVLGAGRGWNITDALRFSGSFERIHPLNEAGIESTAITALLEYTDNELWKATTRLEVRQSSDAQSLLNTVGLLRKLSRDWTALAQHTLSINRSRDTDDQLYDQRLRAGLAYRQTDTNVWNALARYELKLQSDDSLGDERKVHVWSSAANVHPRHDLSVSTLYSGKYVATRTGVRSSSSAHSFGAHINYDITERIDLGLSLGVLGNRDFTTRKSQFGAEAGYLLISNLWVSAGYNWFGYEDRDLHTFNYTNPGVYARFRFKFTEDLFGWLN